MPKETYRDWIDYYKRKGESETDLRQISGYDHPLAQLTEAGLKNLVNNISWLLDLQTTDSLLDIGCGAGLLTKELESNVNMVCAMDANRTMLDHAPARLNRTLGEARSLPFTDASFDKTLCHSVIQYFPDLPYTNRSLQEMTRVTKRGGRCLVMDIPDLTNKDEYLAIKGPENHNLQRLYYKKQWFQQLFPEAFILEQNIPDYTNSQYRFSVLIRR